MKYIHDYKDGSFCESDAFQMDGIAVTDEQYMLLCEGKLKFNENSEIVANNEQKEVNDAT